MPPRPGHDATQDMLIPAAAIWRRTACCHHSVTPNPAVPVALSSRPDSRWELHTPAATCADVHALCMFVCAYEGACCASIFAARISDKPNESPESCYLLAYSCSVLSSLFSGSVFPFLLSFPLLSPLLAVCILIHCLSLRGGFLPPSAHKLPLFVLATQAHPN